MGHIEWKRVGDNTECSSIFSPVIIKKKKRAKDTEYFEPPRSAPRRVPSVRPTRCTRRRHHPLAYATCPSPAWAPHPPPPDRAAAAASAASSPPFKASSSSHFINNLTSPRLFSRPTREGEGELGPPATASGSRWLPCFPSLLRRRCCAAPPPRQPAKSSQQVVATSPGGIISGVLVSRGTLILSVRGFGVLLLLQMLPTNRNRPQQRPARSWYFISDMDFSDPKRKPRYLSKILMVALLTAMCVVMLTQPPCHRRTPSVDNLSRGNMGAIKVLQNLFPEPGRLQFIYADLGDPKAVNRIFAENAFDAVMHFAAVAYVEAMAAHNVRTLIYSSTCATYGEPEKMPITEGTPQFPINPYGKAKKMAEDIILDFSKSKKADMAVMILRYFNVIGSDPEGRLGEAPKPELREHGRISGACFDAALGIIPGLKVKGTDYETPDGTCVRDYIDVTDLVDAHVKALNKAERGKVGIYNVGTGKGRSVKEFVEACKKATGVDIKVDYFPRRPGDYAEVYSDPAKINSELNWTAQHTDLLESLRVAWTWQKKHRSGYGPPQAMVL
uniref:NAD-dependent epimerase/dehydratase domain-containing protein n=1 Tax=Oryza meridionalis TaxID=40149 RepID=A0A0E0C123_9ORYZ